MRDLHERIEEIKKECGAEKFAFDGCHKIYLVEDEHDIEEAKSYGYDIYPIERLERVFRDSCQYRFINNWKLDKKYIEQCEFNSAD